MAGCSGCRAGNGSCTWQRRERRGVPAAAPALLTAPCLPCKCPPPLEATPAAETSGAPPHLGMRPPPPLSPRPSAPAAHPHRRPRLLGGGVRCSSAGCRLHASGDMPAGCAHKKHPSPQHLKLATRLVRCASRGLQAARPSACSAPARRPIAPAPPSDGASRSISCASAAWAPSLPASTRPEQGLGSAGLRTLA